MLGVFDSGSGGLTVLRSMVDAFPSADVLYLGDHARAPYGDRSDEEIARFTHEAVDWMFAQGCDRILLACNTASAIALQERKDDRIFGIVSPTTEWINRQSDSVIGLLATQATIRSGLYAGVGAHMSCPAWVMLLEDGDARSEEAERVVSGDIMRLHDIEDRIDTIVLACTHYPAFHDFVEAAAKSFNPSARVVDQGAMVVDWVHKNGHAPEGGHGERLFFTSGDPKKAAKTAEHAFGQPVSYTKVAL